MSASRSCEFRSIRFQPSGSVTAKPLSANSMRPVVARLAPAVAVAAVDGATLGAAVAATLAPGEGVVTGAAVAVVPLQAAAVDASARTARPPRRRREGVGVIGRWAPESM